MKQALYKDIARSVRDHTETLRTKSVEAVESVLDPLVDHEKALDIRTLGGFSTWHLGHWAISVSNDGDKRASNVVLRVPTTELALIRRKGSQDELREIDSVIDLATLAIGESVRIDAWGYSISGYQLDDVELVHSEGDGSISVKRPLAEPWFHISNYWFFYMVLGVVPLVVVALTLLERRLSGTKGDEQDQDDHDEEPTETEAEDEGAA